MEFFTLTNTSLSQELISNGGRGDYRIRVFGAYNFNMHGSDFSKLPETVGCCPIFESGPGPGFLLGARFEYPIIEYLVLQLRAGYSILNGTLTASAELTSIIHDILLNILQQTASAVCILAGY